MKTKYKLILELNFVAVSANRQAGRRLGSCTPAVKLQSPAVPRCGGLIHSVTIGLYFIYLHLPCGATVALQHRTVHGQIDTQV